MQNVPFLFRQMKWTTERTIEHCVITNVRVILDMLFLLLSQDPEFQLSAELII